MAKTVNLLAAKLAAARREIDNLKRQINDLSLENERLRASSACSTPTRGDSEASPTTTPQDHKPRSPSTTYDKPTEAYKRRLAETFRGKQKAEPVKRPEYRIGCGTYTYMNACLVRIDSDHSPRYMNSTQSSSAKMEILLLHSFLRARKSTACTDERSPSPKECDQTPKITTPPKETGEDTSTSPKPSLDKGEDLRALLSEPVSKLFPGNILRVPSKIGHDMLAAAYRTAQETFYEASHKYVC